MGVDEYQPPPCYLLRMYSIAKNTTTPISNAVILIPPNQSVIISTYLLLSDLTKRLALSYNSGSDVWFAVAY